MTTTESRDTRPADIGQLEWKALPAGATSSPMTGVIGHDDEEGTITAIVAVSGVVDEVGDVFVPGSLAVAVKRLKPKGVDAHDWKTPVSRAEWATELMPGDDRLPKTTPDGDPWPVNAGGLLIKARYNLKTRAGRDAYENAKFYGPEQPFSVGYKVRPGGAKMRGGRRYLSDYDIYEYSQVLHGAHRLAHLTGVKSLHAETTDTDTWYDDPRSGLVTVEGIEVKVRTVRDAKFWGMPVGTPIKPGMKPRGVTPGRSTNDLSETPGAPSVAGADAPATAIAHLGERISELKAVDTTPGGLASVAAIASTNMLTQFTRPGATVLASPDAQIAAVNNGKGWVIVDTANGSPLPMLPTDTPPDQVEDALTEIAGLGIPWDDVAARKKRWATQAAKKADQDAVTAIITKHSQAATIGTALGATPPPKGMPSADAAQARYDAEGAISDGNRDELADALTRMGLSKDQDPHDVASTLLVLPTEVAQQRLDKIANAANPAGGAGKPGQAPGGIAQPPSKPGGLPNAPAGVNAPPPLPVTDQEAQAAHSRITGGTPAPDDQTTVERHAREQVGKPGGGTRADGPYVPTGNMNAPEKLTDDQLEAEHAAATARHARARGNNLPKTSTEYSDSKLAEKIFSDEKRKREAVAAVQPKPHGETASDKPTDAVPVPPDVADRAESIRDEALGITEDPDGTIEVTEEVAARQDRVEAALEAGETGLTDKTTPELQATRKDLTDELALQTELARRDAARKREAATSLKTPAESGGSGATSGPAGQPEDTGPRLRPGVAGAAEDLGDLLNAKDSDPAAVKAAADRLAKLLRRVPADSNAFNDLHKVIGDDIHGAIARGELKPGMLFTAAGALREERRVKRNAGAKKRRIAKRIERDRIRALLGSVNAELTRRETGEKPGKSFRDRLQTVVDTQKAASEATAAKRKPDPLGLRARPIRSTDSAQSKPEAKTPALSDMSTDELRAERARLRHDDRTPDETARFRALGDEILERDDQAHRDQMASERTRGAIAKAKTGPELRDALGSASDEELTAAADHHKGDRVRTALIKEEAEKRSARTPKPAEGEPSERDRVNGEAADAHSAIQDAHAAAVAAAKAGDHGALVRALQAMGRDNPRERAAEIEAAPEARRLGLISLPSAQSGHDDAHHGAAGGDGSPVVPGVPTTGVRQDRGQDEVLQSTGRPSPAGDTAGGRRTGGDRPAGGDVPAEGRPATGRRTGGDGTGDAGNVDESAAPGLAGQRLPASADTGSEHPPADTDTSGQRTGRGSERLPATGGAGESRAGEQSAGGDADRAAPAGEPELAQPEATPNAVESIPDAAQSFQPTSGNDLAPAGKKAKLDANLAALETLRELQNEKRPATPAEQAILARWAGWGGLPEVFDDLKPDYAADRNKLRGLLSDSEWNEAKRNTLNAHYTDATAVQAMWKAVQDLGLDGGRVLEPGSGSGNFIGFAPENIDMVGVELDSTTAAIAHALYPNATIRNESFADTRIPAGHFDATIGNVPFGDFKLTDRVHNSAGDSIHNHFIAKSLDLTKPGGIVAVLTSRYTLDSKGSAARKRLAEKGDLLGAVRLPTGSQQRASGTSTIGDILIFRRREPGAAPQTPQGWINSTDREVDGHTVAVNDYFTEHPDQVLGELHAEPGQYGSGEVRVIGDKTMADLPQALARITDAAKEQGLTSSPRLTDDGALVDPDTSRHEGHIGVDDDGNFTQAVGGAAVPIDVPEKQKEELRGLIGMRDTLSSLLAAEAANVSNTPEIKQLRADLNAQYDAYTGRYGPINRYTLTKTGARNTPGQGGFRRDPMSAIVRALETYDPETGKGHKTSIFTKRAVAPRVIPTTADNPKDALALSMDSYGRVDLGAIAKMLGTDETEARKRLGDLVFEQPPLSVAEANAAINADAEARGLLADTDLAADDVDLSTVGESVAEAGSLEPAAAYLSGNVRRKLAVAKAAAEHDPRFTANVAALEKVVPEDLGAAEIDGRLGAAWIGPSDIKAFVEDMLGVSGDRYSSVSVATSGGGIWTVDAPSYGKLATEQWGTDRKSFGELVQAMLEQRPIKVVDTIDGKSYPNLEDTLAAQAKAEEIQERFSEWLWEDAARARRLQGVYNDRFNAIVLRSYDGTERAFPGMAQTFTPRPHQVAAVERIVSEPAALLGHVVGAGKTAEMAMGASELKRLGLANKPAIVVPNHMLEQFSREFLQIYPQAKILAAGTKDLDGDKRREFVARAATGDWDCVILTQGAFEAIPMSKDQQKAYIDRELATMRAELLAMQSSAASGKAHDNTVKRMEKAVVRAEEAMKKKLDKQKDVGVSFDQTGIDHVMVDEAHMYSNLRTPSNIQGAAIEGSDRATDLHMKLEYLRDNSQSGKVATFATGTPIRNSITQMYVMQRFMRPDLLQEAGIHTFDQWAATFGQVVEEMELKPEGVGFRQTSRFAKFRNVPELLRLFHVFADIKTAEDLNLPTPALETGAVQNVTVQPSEELRAYVAELGERAEAVRNRAVEPEEDNMLKISGDGRKAALSMALVGGEHTSGKIEDAADKIHAIYLLNKDRPVPKDLDNPDAGDDPPPGGMQLVFLDMGTPGNPEQWNAYAKLRDELALRGMDPKGVRFIHEAKNDVQKAEMFAAARNGSISVLVGSSEKMGVGTNVQRRAVALHHLDAPWRPADVEQRDGRIMRQGNTNATVGIYRYVTEGSFDAYMWQTLARKQKFIEQIMRGNLDAREIEDVGDTALSYDEVKALATGNMDLMAKAKADTAVAKLSKLERVHNRTQTNLGKDITSYTANAAQADADAKVMDAAIKQRTDTSGDSFRADIAGAGFDKRADAAMALKDKLGDVIDRGRYAYGTPRPVQVGSIGGHVLMAKASQGREQRMYVDLSFEGLPGTIATMSQEDVNKLGVGTIAKIENGLAGFEFRRDRLRGRAEHLRSEVTQMKTRVGMAFPKADELRAARTESARLEAKLQAAGVDTAVPTGPASSPASEAVSAARSKAARAVANMGRSTHNKAGKVVLQKFVNPQASGKVYASPDGALGAMDKGGDLDAFMTADGVSVRPAGLSGVVDDPAALLADLQALDIPWGSGSSQLQHRWSTYSTYDPSDYELSYQEQGRRREARRAEAREREKADRAAINAVWKRHLVPEGKSDLMDDVLISGFDLLRAQRLGVEVKAKPSLDDAPDPEVKPDPDEESYAETVAADIRYVMDASGVMHKVWPCADCGNDVQAPVGSDSKATACPSCGSKAGPRMVSATGYQMQPSAATVG